MILNKVLLGCGVRNLQGLRSISSSSASITKIHREVYARSFPTVVVMPDGATINIRYHEPRKIIRLPLDLSTLTEAERKARIESRKPKKKIRVEDDVDDSFNANKYLKYIKK